MRDCALGHRVGINNIISYSAILSDIGAVAYCLGTCHTPSFNYITECAVTEMNKLAYTKRYVEWSFAIMLDNLRGGSRMCNICIKLDCATSAALHGNNGSIDVCGIAKCRHLGNLHSKFLSHTTQYASSSSHTLSLNAPRHVNCSRCRAQLMNL